MLTIISLPRRKCLELCEFFPFHCKYAHSLFWYLGSVLSTLGIWSCYLDLRCRYSFSITIIINLLVTAWEDSDIYFRLNSDYKVPTKSCVPGLLGGLALIWENPASGAGISEIKRLSICDRKENSHIYSEMEKTCRVPSICDAEER